MEIYMILFTLYMCLRRIVPFNWLLNYMSGTPTGLGFITVSIYVTFATIGIILILFDLKKQRICTKTYNYKLLIIFIGIMTVSSIWNIRYGYIDNLGSIFNAIIQYFLFYTLYIRLGDNGFKNYFRKLFNILIPIWSIAVIVSIGQFISCIHYTTVIEGVERCQGFSSQRLFGIFIDPNYAAITCIILMISAVYNFKYAKNKFIKAFYVITIIFNYIYSILSLSRTADICLYVCTFLIVLLYARKYLKKIYLYLSIAILSMAGLYFLNMGTIALFKTLPKAYENIFHIKKEVEQEEDITLDRIDVENENISNNRTYIWKSYLSSLKGHYIIGLSPENARSYIKDVYPESYVAKTNYVVHNGYLKVFISTGVLGALIFIIFFVLNGKQIINTIIHNKNLENDFICLITITVGLMIFGFFFNELFLIQNFTTILFWPILGYLNSCKQQKPTIKQVD